MINTDSLLSSYNYELPENLIAQKPSIPAHNAKMMILNPKEWNYSIEDSSFIQLPKYLNNNYLIFLNRTKVFKARIPLEGEKIIRKSWKEVINALFPITRTSNHEVKFSSKTILF